MRQTHLEPFCGFTILGADGGPREGKCVRGHGVGGIVTNGGRLGKRSAEIDSGETPSLVSARSFIRTSPGSHPG
jgi:hypothetical protein